MSQPQSHSQTDLAARDTSSAVQLFQDAHQKMVMLKRVEEQMAQLVQRRRSLMDELRHVQGQINEEFERMFQAGQDMPARLKSLAAGAGMGAREESGDSNGAASREAAFADASVLVDE